jgi:hypothetical protein
MWEIDFVDVDGVFELSLPHYFRENTKFYNGNTIKFGYIS